MSDAALLLTNRISPTHAEPLKAKEFWSLCERMDPEDLLGLAEKEVAQCLGNAELAARVVALLGESSAFADARAELEEGGVTLLSPSDPHYPKRFLYRLGIAAPPVLYAAGPLNWLSSELIGVVGSRSVDEVGAEVSRRAAEAAASVDSGVVSGGAKGVDSCAMRAAYEAEIPCVGITAEGLQRASRRPDLRGAVSDSRLLLISPYAPGSGFSVGNAMGRNKLIYALARATLVVAADHETGGTWAGATEALRRSFGPVIVWTGGGQGPGNASLVERGALPINDLDNKALLDIESADPPARISQLGFGI